MRPEITFFCELHADALKKLFEDRFVFDDLKTLNAGIAMGILDLSPERAKVVRNLNRMGIPATAWLLLPEAEGYWFNLENHAEATARYQALRRGVMKTSLCGKPLDWILNLTSTR